MDYSNLKELIDYFEAFGKELQYVVIHYLSIVAKVQWDQAFIVPEG